MTKRRAQQTPQNDGAAEPLLAGEQHDADHRVDIERTSADRLSSSEEQRDSPHHQLKTPGAIRLTRRVSTQVRLYAAFKNTSSLPFTPMVQPVAALWGGRGGGEEPSVESSRSKQLDVQDHHLAEQEFTLALKDSDEDGEGKDDNVREVPHPGVGGHVCML